MAVDALVEVSGLRAKDLLGLPALVVNANESVDLVWSRLRHAHSERAVVAGTQGWLGVVEMQDLWVRWAIGLAGGAGRVLPLVEPAPILPAETPLLAVCQALRAAARGVALVQDEDGSLLGVITAADVVRGLTRVSAEQLA